MGEEWQVARTDGRSPNWGIFTTSYISASCTKMASDHPDWHRDIYALDLSTYIKPNAKKKPWWLHGPQVVEAPDEGTLCLSSIFGSSLIDYTVIMDDHGTNLPQHPLPLSPSTRVTRATKGKARETPIGAPEAPHDPPYGLRKGTKRRANDPASADIPPEPTAPSATTEDEEVTPRKSDARTASDLPSVQVDGGSPSPSQGAQGERGAVSTGEVRFPVVIFIHIYSYQLQNMCGPCRKTQKSECRSQVGTRLTTACTYCAVAKLGCHDPTPSWAKPIFDAMSAARGTLS